MKSSNISSRKRLIRQRGAVMAEVAVSLPIFLLIVITGLELLRVSFMAAKFDNAVSQSGRYAALGFEESTGGPNRAINSVKRYIASKSGMPIPIFKICPGDVTTCSTNGRGVANSWVTISAQTNIPVAFGAISIPFTAQTIVRNEPRWELHSTSSELPTTPQ